MILSKYYTTYSIFHAFIFEESDVKRLVFAHHIQPLPAQTPTNTGLTYSFCVLVSEESEGTISFDTEICLNRNGSRDKDRIKLYDVDVLCAMKISVANLVACLVPSSPI